MMINHVKNGEWGKERLKRLIKFLGAEVMLLFPTPTLTAALRRVGVETWGNKYFLPDDISSMGSSSPESLGNFTLWALGLETGGWLGTMAGGRSWEKRGC